jgi:periplasmic divalent cation tolerance protein
MSDYEAEREQTGSGGDNVILIYTTFPMQSQAQNTGRHLVETGLAACVNIFPGMVSVYSWQGKVEEAAETAMIVKTVKAREQAVLEAIQQLHPHDVPARLVLPVTGGGRDFLDWIIAQSTPQR